MKKMKELKLSEEDYKLILFQLNKLANQENIPNELKSLSESFLGNLKDGEGNIRFPATRAYHSFLVSDWWETSILNRNLIGE